MSAGAPAQPASRRRLSSDVALMLANKAVVLGVGVVSSVIIARSLGPSGRGSLAVAVALAAILVQLGSIGFQTANPYFVAHRGVTPGTLVSNSLWLASVVGSVLIAAAVGIKLVVPAVIGGLTWPQLLIAAATVPAMLATLFLQGVLLGAGRTLAYNLVEAGCAVGSLAALATIELVSGLTVTAALVVVLAWHTCAALAFVILTRDSPAQAGLDLRLMRQMAAYAFRIYATGLIAYAVVRLDVLLVNGYLGSAEAGYYALAVALLDVLYVVPLVVAVNLFPRVARGEDPAMSALVFRTVALPYAIMCLVAALLAVRIFEGLYGSAFAPSASLFWWLAPGAFCTGMLNILSYHFAGRGYPRQILWYWLVGLAANVAINVALLPVEGTYIASLASSITYALLLVLHVRLFAIEARGYRSLIPRPFELFRTLRGALVRS